MADNHSTVTVQLGAPGAGHLHGEVAISRVGDTLSTASARPAGIESDSANPEPVSGYAEQREFAASMEEEELIPVRDGPQMIPEVVIGPDDRVQVTTPTAWPYAVTGHLQMTFPNGRRYIGSGTMVGRHHVLTAGHCVYSRADGGWAKQISFEAARNGNDRPFGTQMAIRLLSVEGWTSGELTEFDMGMLILDGDVGDRTGYMGVITGPAAMLQQYRVNVTGYPGDKGGTTMWTHADVIKAVAAERLIYDIDTAGGQSGCDVWSTWNGHVGEKLCGIHTTGHSSGNGATRISRAKFDRVVDWMTHY